LALNNNHSLEKFKRKHNNYKFKCIFSSSVEDDDDGDEDSSPLLNETKDDVPFDDEMDQEDLTSSNNVEKVDNPNEIGGFTVLGEVKGKAHKQVCSSCALCNLIGVNEEKILPTNIHLNVNLLNIVTTSKVFLVHFIIERNIIFCFI
jgi:hypothetical protein